MFEIVSICKGGGYKYCRTNPPHPRRNAKGLYPLHRVLMENKLGRLLESGEDVHHEDEDKSNDTTSNLEVLTKSDHARHHHPEFEMVDAICSWCQKPFQLKARAKRLREKRNLANRIYCSRGCATIFNNKSR